jgi:hypothetical protein
VNVNFYLSFVMLPKWPLSIRILILGLNEI